MHDDCYAKNHGVAVIDNQFMQTICLDNRLPSRGAGASRDGNHNSDGNAVTCKIPFLTAARLNADMAALPTLPADSITSMGCQLHPFTVMALELTVSEPATTVKTLHL